MNYFLPIFFLQFFIFSCSNQEIENEEEFKRALVTKQNEILRQKAEKELNQRKEECQKLLSYLKGPLNISSRDWPTVPVLCENVLQFEDECKSVNGQGIYHFDYNGHSKEGTRIFAFSMIHGDEHDAGRLMSYWMQRLFAINPRNTWRIIPLVNPDGRDKSSRLNANKVDLNRNFPTKNWDKEAHYYFNKRVYKNPRRYPGPSAASEPETKCLIKHIKEFKPDLIVSIHTPIGVLDFDGPKEIKLPKIRMLPQRRLGHIPGSLGRYMWRDHKVPVLTIELKGVGAIPSLRDIEELQDLIGTVSIQTSKYNIPKR